MAAPDPVDGTNTEARRLGHQDAGLVGRFAGWIAKRQGDNPLGRLAIERLDPRGPGLVAKQTLEPFFQEAFLPAPNASLGLAGSSHDLVRAGPIGREEMAIPTGSICGAIEARTGRDLSCSVGGLGALSRAMSRRVVICGDKSLLDPPLARASGARSIWNTIQIC
jgi:hypothetical protein